LLRGLNAAVPDRLPDEKERLERQIDALVYELYGWTAEEIKIVEEN
jgi:hypothetical protein